MLKHFERFWSILLCEFSSYQTPLKLRQLNTKYLVITYIFTVFLLYVTVYILYLMTSLLY